MTDFLTGNFVVAAFSPQMHDASDLMHSSEIVSAQRLLYPSLSFLMMESVRREVAL
jgi:hypothetical protein